MAALTQVVTSTWERLDLLENPQIMSDRDRVMIRAFFHARAKSSGAECDVRMVEAHDAADGQLLGTVVHHWDTAAMLAAFGSSPVAHAETR